MYEAYAIIFLNNNRWESCSAPPSEPVVVHKPRVLKAPHYRMHRLITEPARKFNGNVGIDKEFTIYNQLRSGNPNLIGVYFS